jgi:hypothetical protein
MFAVVMIVVMVFGIGIVMMFVKVVPAFWKFVVVLVFVLVGILVEVNLMVGGKIFLVYSQMDLVLHLSKYPLIAEPSFVAYSLSYD